MKKGATGPTTYRSEYIAFGWRLERVRLRFDIGEDATLVHSELLLHRQHVEGTTQDLVLHGQELELLEVVVDGQALSQEAYRCDADQLVIPALPDRCTLNLSVRIKPQENSALEGLYACGNFMLTQCEAEGFRKITYFPDRPDVMTTYEVTIEADRNRYPVLLSNGNRVDSGETEDNRHWVTWHDPFPKPCYLFALVAGDLAHIEDEFVTASTRRVTLRVYVEHRNIDRCRHAMDSLIKSMRWDEERFGLEYDLDVYNVVATDDFNMGAMENKSLNIFNSKYVLARPDTATDADYQAIEGVIGHEYFHNWTGNRVTCRDWFQLTLKEGLTVFRDQEFSADMQSRAVQRIQDVRVLRNRQFPEDAGPMSHPIRPDEYVEVNNFYTMTVYQKGATIIRMFHTILGEEGFQKGMKLYFERHDGQAVTCDDFIAAMADANDTNLAAFGRWYQQSGTPQLTVTSRYDADLREYTLSIRQHTPPTQDQPDKVPLVIPLRMGLLGSDGAALPLQLAGEAADASVSADRLFLLHEEKESITFVNVDEAPVPSLLREFSAPVKLSYDYSDADLALLMARDSDTFVRWEAAQLLAQKGILDQVAQLASGKKMQMPEAIVQAFSKLVADGETDPALIAEALILPSEEYLAEQMDTVDVDGIFAAREFTKSLFAQRLWPALVQRYAVLNDGIPYAKTAEAVSRRRLKNVLLAYLVTQPDGQQYAEQQLRASDNMTDTLAALRSLVMCGSAVKDEALSEFEDRWSDDPLVTDKWFSLQAMVPGPGTAAQVKRLMGHAAFSIRNPNKVRALLGVFSMSNPTGFHTRSGDGYALVADQVIELNAINPQMAARTVSAFNQWRRYDDNRSTLMREQLQRIADIDGLSPDVGEIVANALET